MQSMTWVWAEPSTWKLWWLERQFMGRDAAGAGGGGGEGREAGWWCQSRAKEDSQKHLLITHNLQSLPQGAVRRNRDCNRHNWREEAYKHCSCHEHPLLNAQPLHAHAHVFRENITSASFYTQSPLWPLLWLLSAFSWLPPHFHTWHTETP